MSFQDSADWSKWSAVRQPGWIIVLVLWWRTFTALVVKGRCCTWKHRLYRDALLQPSRHQSATLFQKRWVSYSHGGWLDEAHIKKKKKEQYFTAERRLWWRREGGGRGQDSWWKLTSRAQKAPSYIDGGGEEAVLLGAAVVAADHDVMGEDDAARRHTDVAGVISRRTADAVNQTTWKRGRGFWNQSWVVLLLGLSTSNGLGHKIYPQRGAWTERSAH